MFDEDSLKVRLADLGKDSAVYVLDPSRNNVITAAKKAAIYIGRYGFEYDAGGRDYLFTYYYSDYGDTWAFTKKELEKSKNRKAYVITSGEYSDKGIVAVFTDAKKARLFLNVWNKTHTSFFDYAQIEEYNLSDDSINTDRQEVLVEYLPEENFAVMCNIGYDGAKAINNDRVVQKEYPCSARTAGTKHDVFQFMLDVNAIKPNDKDGKLEKIAQDRYAQYKARREGVAT